MFLYMICLSNKKLLKVIIYKMRAMKQINTKNHTYYFYNDIVDLKDFDAVKN